MGNLYLAGIPLGPEYEQCFDIVYRPIFKKVAIYLVENLKAARKMISRYRKIDHSLTFIEIGKHATINYSNIENIFINQKQVILLSDVGQPCLADPGHKMVMLAHKTGIKVIPLPSYSSIGLALITSGFQAQNYTFHGYLPIEEIALKKKLQLLEKDIIGLNTTEICIEAPHRNNKLFKCILKYLNSDIGLCIAHNLHHQESYILNKKIHQWKQASWNIEKKPTVFILGK